MRASPTGAVKANCIRRRLPLYVEAHCMTGRPPDPTSQAHPPTGTETDRTKPPPANREAQPNQPTRGGKNSPRPQRSRPEPRAQDQGIATRDSAWEPRVRPRADRGQSMLVCMLLPVKNQQNRESCFVSAPGSPGGHRAKPVRARLRAGSRKKRAKCPRQLHMCRQGPV